MNVIYDIRQKNGKIEVRYGDLERKVSGDWVAMKNFSKEGEKIKIVIDAGHGGSDPGAVGAGIRDHGHDIYESDLNLKIAKELEDLLKRQNYSVFVTRSRDDDISLNDRTAIANQSNADLFISIHCNAAGTSTANGFEVWCFNVCQQSWWSADSSHMPVT